MAVPDVLSSAWDDVVGRQPAPDQGLVVISAVAALLLVLVPAAWHVGRHLVTIAHEGAHGLVALLSGRRLSGIRVHSDTSGLTVSRGRPTGAGMVATTLAGYLGPAALGLGAAYLLRERHALAVLWLAVLLLALLLLQIRNFYGLYAVGVAGAAVFAVTWWGNGTLQTAVAYVGTWFILLGSQRPVLELQSHRRAGRARTSDADVLARLTGVPGLLWVAVFLLATLAAAVLGGMWLVGPMLGPAT